MFCLNGLDEYQGVEELEKKQEWWWAAEKKRSKRLDYLRKAIWKKGCIGGKYNPGERIRVRRARYAKPELEQGGRVLIRPSRIKPAD